MSVLDVSSNVYWIQAYKDEVAKNEKLQAALRALIEKQNRIKIDINTDMTKLYSDLWSDLENLLEG